MGGNPDSLGSAKPISYIALIALLLFVTTLHGRWRFVVLVPTLYLAAFVWENVMSREPDVTRFILMGALLVGVMVTRPTGILGEKRVEVV